jgi:Ca-activated chloride channel family protein
MKGLKKIMTLISSMCFLSSHILLSQLQFDKTTYDFGDIYAHNVRFVDFYIKNTSVKTEFVLTIEKPKAVNYRLSSSSIQPDSSTALRIQVNPEKKGGFHLKIPVYISTSNDAVELHVKGNFKELPQKQGGSLTDCPSFSKEPGDGNPLDFKLKVVTVDEETRELIPSTSVVLIQNGQPVGKWVTDRNGSIIKKVPLGLSYFFAKNENYQPAELGAYINSQRNYIIIPMKRKEIEEEIIPPNDSQNEIVINDTETPNNDDELREKLRELLITSNEIETPNDQDSSITIKLKEVDRDNFDADLFQPINVVFVIDVSSSMNQADRLELMKYSLLELADMLRSQDKISLVSYATNANVLLPSIAGHEKKEIKEEIVGLKAQGLTAGGKGIKLGFKQARRNFIKNGKNHVIIITDGGFNRESGNYKKVIAKNLKKGVTLSVVGIKNNDKARVEMEEAAKIGDGEYIPIKDLLQAQENLRNEIRKITFKGL